MVRPTRRGFAVDRPAGSGRKANGFSPRSTEGEAFISITKNISPRRPSVSLQGIRFLEEQIVPLARVMLDYAGAVQEGRKDADTVRDNRERWLQIVKQGFHGRLIG